MDANQDKEEKSLEMFIFPFIWWLNIHVSNNKEWCSVQIYHLTWEQHGHKDIQEK